MRRAEDAREDRDFGHYALAKNVLKHVLSDTDYWTHEELKRRADQAGMSLQACVAQLLERSTSTPSLDDWLRGLGELSRHDVSGAEIMRSVRNDLP